MGHLAGGVSHDFNNILTAILGFCDVLGGHPGADVFVREQAGQIKKSAKRASTLTRQLLAFGRAQPLRPHPVKLNTIIIDLEKMLRRLIRENIALSIQTDPDLGPILAEPGQIEQVIINLVINAREAMPHGGRLSIRTSGLDIIEPPPTSSLRLPPGSYAVLTIADTGVGISDEMRIHLFEPFFTTKEKGQGTGLGLATVYGIVQQSGGHIVVESQLDAGTTFQLYFPISVQPGETASSSSAPMAMVAPGRGTGEIILLAEDEPDLRHLIRNSLGSLGYTVLIAEDGLAARELLMSDPLLKIDLLITDVVMPRLGGGELADWVTHHRPHTPVLFISGFIDDPVTRQIIAQVDTHFLEKPFTLASLGAKIRHILDLSPKESSNGGRRDSAFPALQTLSRSEHA